MDVGMVQGGPWTVYQVCRSGSCMRCRMAASDKDTQVSKLLSDDPERRTREDVTSLRGLSFSAPHITDGCSREVGRNEIIWTRATS